MSKQPEALRLAEVLTNFSATQHNPDNAAKRAAAEDKARLLMEILSGKASA